MGWNIAKGKIVFQFTEGVFLATTTRNKGEQLLSLPLFGIRHDCGIFIETIIGRERSNWKGLQALGSFSEMNIMFLFKESMGF
jgi:hypothetical protein